MFGLTREGARHVSLAWPDFPDPIGKLGHYVVWWRPEIVAWMERHPNVYRKGSANLS